MFVFSMYSVGANVIETAALGRPFQLGMLYDCRKDALIPGTVFENMSKSSFFSRAHLKQQRYVLNQINI